MDQAAWKTRFKNSLDQLERHILIMRRWDKLEMAEIGIVFNLTAAHIEHLLLDLHRRAKSYRRIEALNRGDV